MFLAKKKTHFRAAFRLVSRGGGQKWVVSERRGGAGEYLKARGVWGHAPPPGNFAIFKCPEVTSDAFQVCNCKFDSLIKMHFEFSLWISRYYHH